MKDFGSGAVRFGKIFVKHYRREEAERLARQKEKLDRVAAEEIIRRSGQKSPNTTESEVQTPEGENPVVSKTEAIEGQMRPQLEAPTKPEEKKAEEILQDYEEYKRSLDVGSGKFTPEELARFVEIDDNNKLSDAEKIKQINEILATKKIVEEFDARAANVGDNFTDKEVKLLDGLLNGTNPERFKKMEEIMLAAELRKKEKEDAEKLKAEAEKKIEGAEKESENAAEQPKAELPEMQKMVEVLLMLHEMLKNFNGQEVNREQAQEKDNLVEKATGKNVRERMTDAEKVVAEMLKHSNREKFVDANAEAKIKSVDEQKRADLAKASFEALSENERQKYGTDADALKRYRADMESRGTKLDLKPEEIYGLMADGYKIENIKKGFFGGRRMVGPDGKKVKIKTEQFLALAKGAGEKYAASNEVLARDQLGEQWGDAVKAQMEKYEQETANDLNGAAEKVEEGYGEKMKELFAGILGIFGSGETSKKLKEQFKGKVPEGGNVTDLIQKFVEALKKSGTGAGNGKGGEGGGDGGGGGSGGGGENGGEGSKKKTETEKALNKILKENGIKKADRKILRGFGKTLGYGLGIFAALFTIAVVGILKLPSKAIDYAVNDAMNKGKAPASAREFANKPKKTKNK